MVESNSEIITCFFSGSQTEKFGLIWNTEEMEFNERALLRQLLVGQC